MLIPTWTLVVTDNRFHTPEYIARVQKMSSEQGGDAGECAPVGVGSFDVACLSAGGVISVVDAVINGKVRNAYALVRPPGHHAERVRFGPPHAPSCHFR